MTDAGKLFVEKNVLRMHRVEESAWQQMSGEEQVALIELIRKFSELIRKELKKLRQKCMRGRVFRA